MSDPENAVFVSESGARFCEFCQLWHYASICPHPGREEIQKLRLACQALAQELREASRAVHDGAAWPDVAPEMSRIEAWAERLEQL